MIRDIETHLKNARDYSQSEVFRIINPKQARLYIKNRVYPIDIYTSLDKTGADIIVYVFLQEETKDLYQAWLAHELE